MNVHAIAALFIIVGLILALFCVVQAEVCYRRVRRYLAHNRDARERAVPRRGATERQG